MIRGMSGLIVPKVTIFKHARYDEGSTDAAAEIEVMGRLAHDLEHAPLAGFVAEGYRYVKGGWGHDLSIAFGRDDLLRVSAEPEQRNAADTGFIGSRIERKLGRGMNNATEIFRGGEMTRSIEQAGLFEGPEAAFSTGLVRGMNRTLLMAHENVLDLVLLE